MGYTHYWKGHLPSSSSSDTSTLTTDISKLLTTTTIKISGPSGTGQPKITDTQIAFNGSAEDGEDEGHEPFILDIGEDISFAFCKTARKGYDAVVGAVLLSNNNNDDDDDDDDDGGKDGKKERKRFEVFSDGSWEEWGDARELYLKTFECEAEMPEGMTPSWR
ncbi:hypothetical protein TWF730_001129 [Orbilia blumenaviensis]|uniref:Uncharacterized protein n=1 Tax=Orbilia blumenaviensis TaxID=1796055 RepID=A0AAV9VNQ5_9PEZI